MKTFKQHLSESLTQGGVRYNFDQWMDQDAAPSAETAVEALNAYVGHYGDHEYMNPQVGLRKIYADLSKLGYYFDYSQIGKDYGTGSYNLPLRYGGGTFKTEYSENSYGEFVEGDGISDHIPGGISLMITLTPTGAGKTIIAPEIVRNSDQNSDIE
tara:strand:+ start:226 stop:693 length:468 start_codon:yes stop_codon:yes gene_type:complete